MLSEASAREYHMTGAFIRGPSAGLFAALCLWIGVATAHPAVIVTVDVESTENLPLPQQVDMVCAGGVRCGLLQIARMLEEHKLAGTFFLDVYEYKAWGEPTLRSIAQQLQNRGHDVALHTHPQWAYDPHRPYMYDYTLDEQTRIVAEVERRLSVVEELESVVFANLQRATRLHQSILQKAFTGELAGESSNNRKPREYEPRYRRNRKVVQRTSTMASGCCTPTFPNGRRDA